MPRPRFAKLAPSKQAAILEAAEVEFADHGFHEASYNRIIAAAGVSKGAMYYYFEDKGDLFATVLARAAEGLVDALEGGPQVDSVEDFWLEVQRTMERALAYVERRPRAAALARHASTLQEGGAGLQRMDDAAVQVIEALLLKGQAVGAVRTDLPLALISTLLQRGVKVFDEVAARGDRSPSAESRQPWTDQALDLIQRLVAPATSLPDLGRER